MRGHRASLKSNRSARPMRPTIGWTYSPELFARSILERASNGEPDRNILDGPFCFEDVPALRIPKTHPVFRSILRGLAVTMDPKRSQPTGAALATLVWRFRRCLARTHEHHCLVVEASRRFQAKVGPKDPWHRPRSATNSICTDYQPRKPLLRSFRIASGFKCEGTFHSPAYPGS